MYRFIDAYATRLLRGDATLDDPRQGPIHYSRNKFMGDKVVGWRQAIRRPAPIYRYFDDVNIHKEATNICNATYYLLIYLNG